MDSTFYGVFLHNAPAEAITPWFHGQVIDMLYFPIIRNSVGETIFFSPIFNVADSAISVAVVIILLFYRKELNDSLETKKEKDVEPI